MSTEFTLAYAVDARVSDNLERKVRIPVGTDILITHRFERAASGRRMVEFALPEAGDWFEGKLFRAWADELVPVGSKRQKDMSSARAKMGGSPNPTSSVHILSPRVATLFGRNPARNPVGVESDAESKTAQILKKLEAEVQKVQSGD